MTDEKLSVSKLLRTTVTNSNDFYMQVADHIDKLEQTIRELTTELNDLKKTLDNEIDDHK
jgi:ABC-type transporter Mla subunit MlaD